MTGQRNFGSKTAKQKIRKKGEGVGIMACAFVSAQVGYTCDNHIYMLHTHTHTYVCVMIGNEITNKMFIPQYFTALVALRQKSLTPGQTP